MVGIKIDYEVSCPYCETYCVHHSFDDMDVFRYKRDEVVKHKCEKCKNKFLVSLDNNKTFAQYDKNELYPVLF